MATCKFLFPFFIYFSFLLFSTIIVRAQNSTTFNFKNFGNELERKSLEEVTQHLQSNLDSFCLHKSKTNSMGKYCGYKLLSKCNSDVGVSTYSLQLKYERQIFFITLLFNESIEKWIVSEFKQEDK